MMCPDFCLSHHRQHCLAHGDIAEEIGFKLVAYFVRAERSSPKPGDAETGVVDQHIDATVIAHDGVNHSRDGAEFGDVETAEVELVAHAGLLRGLLETPAAAQVAHGGNDLVAVLGKFNGGQQPDATGTSRNYCDFLITHGSPPNPSDRQRTAKWVRSCSRVCAGRIEYEKITGLRGC